MFHWEYIQQTSRPTAKAAPAPTLSRMGLQYSHWSRFLSESLSLCFICWTFCAVLAILSSRCRFLTLEQDLVKRKQSANHSVKDKLNLMQILLYQNDKRTTAGEQVGVSGIRPSLDKKAVHKQSKAAIARDVTISEMWQSVPKALKM